MPTQLIVGKATKTNPEEGTIDPVPGCNLLERCFVAKTPKGVFIRAKQNSREGTPMLLTLFNGLVGAVCGMWLRVYVLVPLIIVPFFEVAINRHSESWSSASWLAIALLVAIEAGYLAGA